MSDIRINNITNKTGNTGPVVAGVSTVSSSTFMIMPSGNVEIRGGGSGRVDSAISGINDMTGGPVSNKTGRGRTDY